MAFVNYHNLNYTWKSGSFYEGEWEVLFPVLPLDSDYYTKILPHREWTYEFPEIYEGEYPPTKAWIEDFEYWPPQWGGTRPGPVIPDDTVLVDWWKYVGFPSRGKLWRIDTLDCEHEYICDPDDLDTYTGIVERSSIEYHRYATQYFHGDLFYAADMTPAVPEGVVLPLQAGLLLLGAFGQKEEEFLEI